MKGEGQEASDPMPKEPQQLILPCGGGLRHSRARMHRNSAADWKGGVAATGTRFDAHPSACHAAAGNRGLADADEWRKLPINEEQAGRQHRFVLRMWY
jgi:hypothetical protein